MLCGKGRVRTQDLGYQSGALWPLRYTPGLRFVVFFGIFTIVFVLWNLWQPIYMKMIMKFWDEAYKTANLLTQKTWIVATLFCLPLKVVIAGIDLTRPLPNHSPEKGCKSALFKFVSPSIMANAILLLTRTFVPANDHSQPRAVLWLESCLAQVTWRQSHHPSSSCKLSPGAMNRQNLQYVHMACSKLCAAHCQGLTSTVTSGPRLACRVPYRYGLQVK